MFKLKLESFYIPAPAKSVTNNQKTMIVMHGLGDSLESYKVFTKEINVTGLNYLLLNAPKKYYFGHSWYDLAPKNPHTGIIESAKIILEILEELHTKHHIQYEDIFLCGFSQGGAIAMEVFYQIIHPLAGIVALSPRLYPDRIPSRFNYGQLNTPLFIAHGIYDEVIEFAQTKNIIDTHLINHEKLNFKTYDMGHEIDPYEILDLRNWLNERL